MTTSALFEYKILELTESELDSEGIPFLVVTWDIHAAPGLRLQTYISLAADCGEVHSAACHLLNDSSFFAKAGDDLSQSFFSALENLDIGPIRTLACGTCDDQGLRDAVGKYFPRTCTWPEGFRVTL